MTFLDAARAVLQQAGESLSATEITERALQRGWIETRGSTPEATMRAQLGAALERLGDEAGIIRISRGIWGLREWQESEAERPEPEPRPGPASYWFLTTNPKLYDIEELLRKGTEVWGEMISSNVCQKRIREEVRRGDRAFIYRTRPHADVWCEAEVTSGPRPHGRHHVFDVRPLRKLEPPVPLASLRACPELKGLEFLGNTRLSVSHVSPEEYAAIEALVGEETVAADDFSHDLIQWQLIDLGKSFKLDVWVASDCRGHSHDGELFAEHTLSELPSLGFNEETVSLIRGIDVLWLRGSSIVAAFEIEHTTSIYSGLLRLSDLVALQPNINIDLYIVAPASRRQQVIKQVNRPTFGRLPKPLKESCKLVTYEALGELASRVAAVAGFVQPDLITTVAEGCSG